MGVQKGPKYTDVILEQAPMVKTWMFFFLQKGLNGAFSATQFHWKGPCHTFSHFAIQSPIEILGIKCKNTDIFIGFPSPDQSATYIQSWQSLLLWPNPKNFIFCHRVYYLKLCSLLFLMGPQNTKGASMDHFLKGFQESKLWQLCTFNLVLMMGAMKGLYGLWFKVTQSMVL